MGRSQETFNKKEVRNRKEKKRKEKEQKRQARRDSDKKSGLDDMIAYVDANGVITSTPPDPEETPEVELDDIQISVPKQEDLEDIDPIRHGTVTYFNDSKGFGFIRDNETKESVFMHIDNAEEPIKEGNSVIFEVGSGPKGPIALGIKIDR